MRTIHSQKCLIHIQGARLGHDKSKKDKDKNDKMKIRKTRLCFKTMCAQLLKPNWGLNSVSKDYVIFTITKHIMYDKKAQPWIEA